MSSPDLPRYDSATRLKHWAVVLLFALAALSGLAFFHPSLFFLSHALGGPVWARILHPVMGVLMVAVFLALYLKLRADNRISEGDRAWGRQLRPMLAGNKAAMPPVGKYNYGQKLLFWLMSICLLVLLLSGLTFWQPWLAPVFPIGLRRVAVLLHAMAAVVLILGVIVHVYAALWVQGTLRAMTRGSVTAAWARQNHALWHDEQVGKPAGGER